MYAIIADGGRQYKVEEGQELDVDFRDLPTGDELVPVHENLRGAAYFN